jgi:hypothetical protein
MLCGCRRDDPRGVALFAPAPPEGTLPDDDEVAGGDRTMRGRPRPRLRGWSEACWWSAEVPVVLVCAERWCVVELLLLLLGSWLGRGPDADADAFLDVLVTPPWSPVADAFALLFPRTLPLPAALGLCRDSGWGIMSISSLGVGNSLPGVSDGEGKGAERRMLAALGEGEWCPSEIAWW